MVLVIGFVYSKTSSDLIQKLPGTALGVFVWKNNTPIHEEMVRRFGNLSIDGVSLGETFARDARRFAFVFHENPWRVALFAEDDESRMPQEEPQLAAPSRATLRAALISNDGALVSPRFPHARAVSFGLLEKRIAARFKDATVRVAPAFPLTQNDVAYISTSSDVVAALMPLFQKTAPLVFETVLSVTQDSFTDIDNMSSRAKPRDLILQNKISPLAVLGRNDKKNNLPSTSITCALEDKSRWLCGVTAENRADIESWESSARALAQKLIFADQTTSKTILLPDGEIAREAREGAFAHQSKPYFMWQNDARSFVFGTTVMEPRSNEGWSYGCTPGVQGEPFLFIDMNQLDEIVDNRFISSIKPLVSDIITGIYRQGGVIICF